MHILDALVYCGRELSGDALEVPDPLIVVEVASPSTRNFDDTVKLGAIFSLPSVQHDLVVDPEGPPVIDHRRQPEAWIAKAAVHEGLLTQAPPAR